MEMRKPAQRESISAGRLGCPTEILPAIRAEIYVDVDRTPIQVDLQIDGASVI